jgi:transposase InsO family protein
MIDRGHDLPITKQAEVLRISRGSIYYLPRPVPEADLAIMRHLDRLHLEFPFAGSRMLRGLLVAEGCKIGRRHVKTLMQRMGIEALYRRPRTTKPEPGHKIAGNGIAISMDGKGAWRDNVFVERLWRSVKIRGGVSARLTTASAKLVLRSAGILTSTMAAGPTRALTATHPIKPTSTRCPSAWQPNPGRDST